MILQLEGVNTYYGLSHILKSVSLHVEEQETVALLGRNGAGKTTTLRSIMGLTPPREGRVLYKGEDLTGAKPFTVAGKGVAYVPETRDIFSYLTGLENLEIARRSTSRWQVESLFQRFPLLGEIKDRKGRHLSGGEQQMLSIARALMTGPDLLLLDEPSQGLAPVLVDAVMDMIGELRHHQVSMLLVEQNVELAEELADRVYILDQGTVVFEGASQELAENEQVKI
ncbi:MAG: ABC transporter ATP-binding protein, partial [Deltaproteobacteria bacterium]|nr:ABC transporter ATP-binding protein [Deltaproteobacteria bacterium]